MKTNKAKTTKVASVFKTGTRKTPRTHDADGHPIRSDAELLAMAARWDEAMEYGRLAERAEGGIATDKELKRLAELKRKHPTPQHDPAEEKELRNYLADIESRIEVERKRKAGKKTVARLEQDRDMIKALLSPRPDLEPGLCPLWFNSEHERERYYHLKETNRAADIATALDSVKAERDRIESVLCAVEHGGNHFMPANESKSIWSVSYGGKRIPTIIAKGDGFIYIREIIKAGTSGLYNEELIGRAGYKPTGNTLQHVEEYEDGLRRNRAEQAAIDYKDQNAKAKEWERMMRDPDLRRMVEELEGELAEANQEQDANRATNAIKELRNLGHPGFQARFKPRPLPGDTREKMRKAVHKAYRQAIAAIGQEHAEAAAYLKKHVRTRGGVWTYTGETFTT